MKKTHKIVLILLFCTLLIAPVVMAAPFGTAGEGMSKAWGRILNLITQAGFLLILGMIFFWMLFYAIVKAGLDRSRLQGTKSANLIAVSISMLLIFQDGLLSLIYKPSTTPNDFISLNLYLYLK